jgi:hypothetical protein
MDKSELIKLHHRNALFPDDKTTMSILSNYIKEIFQSDKFITDNPNYFAAIYRFTFLINRLTDFKIRKETIETIGLDHDIFRSAQKELWLPKEYGWELSPKGSDLETFREDILTPSLKIWELSEFLYARSISYDTDVATVVNEAFPKRFSPELIGDREKSKKLYRFLMMWYMNSTKLISIKPKKVPVFFLDSKKLGQGTNQKIMSLLTETDLSLVFNMNILLDNLLKILTYPGRAWFRHLDFEVMEIVKSFTEFHGTFTPKTFNLLSKILIRLPKVPNSAIPLELNQHNPENKKKYYEKITSNQSIVSQEIHEDSSLALNIFKRKFAKIEPDMFSYQSESLAVINDFVRPKITTTIYADKDGFDTNTLFQEGVYSTFTGEYTLLSFKEFKIVAEKTYEKTKGILYDDLNLEYGQKQIKKLQKRKGIPRAFMLFSESEEVIYIVDFENMIVQMMILGSRDITFGKSKLYDFFPDQQKPKMPGNPTRFLENDNDYRILLFYLQMHMSGVLDSEIVDIIVQGLGLRDWILRSEYNTYQTNYHAILKLPF